MSFIDVLIPAIIGIVVLLWPKVLFVGSRATPTEQKLRWTLRRHRAALRCRLVPRH